MTLSAVIVCLVCSHALLLRLAPPPAPAPSQLFDELRIQRDNLVSPAQLASERSTLTVCRSFADLQLALTALHVQVRKAQQDIGARFAHGSLTKDKGGGVTLKLLAGRSPPSPEVLQRPEGMRQGEYCAGAVQGVPEFGSCIPKNSMSRQNSLKKVGTAALAAAAHRVLPGFPASQKRARAALQEVAKPFMEQHICIHPAARMALQRANQLVALVNHS